MSRHRLEPHPATHYPRLPSSNRSSSCQSLVLSQAEDGLSAFRDDEIVNIETSIPLLHSVGVLRVIASIEGAKLQLDHGRLSDRLTAEARFLYCLWKMIDEEEVEAREVKEIVYLLRALSTAQLTNTLSQIYPDKEAVEQFIGTWIAIQEQQQPEPIVSHYQTAKKKPKPVKNQENILARSLRQAGDLNNIRSHFLRPTQKSQLRTMESVEFSHVGKENMVKMDKEATQAMVNRLYKCDIYQEREVLHKRQEQRRQVKEMEQCTFKPSLNKSRGRSFSCKSRSASVNGYDKAVMRLKVGHKKSVEQRRRLDHKPCGENYSKVRGMKENPPKFLSRKGPTDKAQFVIEFDLGRHRVKVRVQEDASEHEIAQSLCKIYTLKSQYYDEICGIIRKERQAQQASTCSQHR